MPVGATLGAAGLGAVGSIAGGLIQNNATQQASAVQEKMFNKQLKLLAPFRQAGVDASGQLISALPSLTAPIRLDQAFLESTPGYAFARRQGLKSVQSGAAARGLGISGAALKGAANYATGLADQTYNTQFQNELAQRQQRFNQLIGTTQLGENAAAGAGAGAIQTGSSIGSNLIGGGNALAGGITGAAGSLGSGATGVGAINFTRSLLGSGYVPAGMYKPLGPLY